MLCRQERKRKRERVDSARRDMASLFPGFVHVDHFGSDGEYESGDEEVSYVTLDLVQAEPQLIPQSSSYRLAGLDTPTPFLQLQGTTFRGEHTELLGSEIIFANGRGQCLRFCAISTG